jgi:succinate dehydrogenase/fumarate reductase flavoprotein subunit
MQEFDADLLVIGGGMAGMAAAAWAARHGASVVVIEKSNSIGGSGLLSGGAFWTTASLDVLRSENPDGSAELGRVLNDGYEEAVDWFASDGLTIGPRHAMEEMVGYPARGITIDIKRVFERWRSLVIAADGWIALDTRTMRLVLTDGQVTGAVVEDRDGLTAIGAKWTLLATGGFQGDPTLRAEHIGPHAEHLLLRSNPDSVGDGLRLGLAAGGTLARQMDGFYGHLMPYPLADPLQPADYVRLAQLNTTKGVLLDHQGRRFVDESRGYYKNAQAVAKLQSGRALFVGDDHIRQADMRGRQPGREQIDRPLEARAAGGHVALADSLGEISEAAAEWGYAGVSDAIQRYNSSLAEPSGDPAPPRLWFPNPIAQPPYFALEVQPAITFTQGGLRIDECCRVLAGDGSPVGGLLAAGADAGGLYRGGYAGGLSMAAVFGIRAARTVLSEPLDLSPNKNKESNADRKAASESRTP